jgi:hypothetical protein
VGLLSGTKLRWSLLRLFGDCAGGRREEEEGEEEKEIIHALVKLTAGTCTLGLSQLRAASRSHRSHYSLRVQLSYGKCARH